MSKFINGRHLFLYAKGHYLRSAQGVLEDLKYVVAATCGLPAASVTEEDIYQVCINTVTSYCAEYQPERAVERLRRLLIEVGKEHFYNDVTFTKNRSPRLAIIQECLSFLAHVGVLDHEGNEMISLGKPDPDVLPLKVLEDIQRQFLKDSA